MLALRGIASQIRSGLKIAALLRNPPTSAGVEETMRDRLARREELFLGSLERLVFAHLGSPYRPLLELAGYDLPKAKQLVSARGLDAALDQLRADGVYVRIQEFKGQEPAVRRGRTFRFTERDFANPAVREIFRTRTGVPHSGGTPTAISTEDLLAHARLYQWLHEHYGLKDRDIVLWLRPGTGMISAILFSLLGHPPLRWLSPARDGGVTKPLLLRVARLASRVRIPPPEAMPAGGVLEVARWISRVNTPRGVLVSGFVSSALHLVLAAEEAGIKLGDVAFLVFGEPLTPVKRRQIEKRGFRLLPGFGFFEIGPTAWACPVGQEPDDLHVLTDRVAVRQHLRVVDRDGSSVPAYLFTTLLPLARHVMLNMESGDYGGLEERRCGCFLDSVGFRLHMHTIRSFEKLTAEGMPFLGPFLITLLEEVLPRKFGGDSRHYQLVKGNDSQGFIRLYLLASPRLGVLNEAAVREVVLRELGLKPIQPASSTRVVRQLSQDAQWLQVVRHDPLPTAGGKILHLHREHGTLRPGDGRSEGGSMS